jgi:acyl carrier protein
METDTTQLVLIRLFAEEFDIDEAELSPGTEIDSLDIDSLDFLCLLTRVREEIGPIETRVAVTKKTIGELADAIVN